MATFDPQLSEVNRSGISRAPVDTSTGEIITTAGQALETGAAVAREVRNDSIVRDFKEDLDEVARQKGKFDRQFKTTFDNLEAGDQQKVKNLKDRLDKLSKGEVQGTLTPSGAKARADSIYRTALAANPALAQEFSRVRNATSFGTSGSGGGMSPQQLAFNEFQEAKAGLMLRGNFTGEQAEGIMNQIEYGRQQQAINELALAKGQGSFNSYLDSVNASSHTFAVDWMGRIDEATKDPNFNPDLFVGEIKSAAAAETLRLNSFLANTGTQLTKEQRNELRASQESMFKMVEDMATSRDPAAIQKRLVERLEGENTIEYYNFLSRMGPRYDKLNAAVGKERAMDLVMGAIPRLLGQLSDGRQNMTRLRELADGDPDLSFALSWIEGNPDMAFEGYMRQLNGALTGDANVAEYYRGMSSELLQEKLDVNADDLKKIYRDEVAKVEDVIGSDVPSTIAGFIQPGFQTKLREHPQLADDVKNIMQTSLAALTPELTEVLSFQTEGGSPISVSYNRDAFANPVTTDVGFFSRTNEPAQFITLDQDVQTAPGRNVQRGAISGRAISNTPQQLTSEAKRKIKKVNTLIAGLVLAGTPQDKIDTIVEKMLQFTSPEQSVEKVSTSSNGVSSVGSLELVPSGFEE